ncbi:homeobox-leucine zipper protein HAT22 [Elaeis guineensis]|uniref:Homeobox-leucine zipper protein HAT9 n=1 Tax=Elaeis guineensis var. tenera TaxID=51953 RepID=A0A6I9S995_ELAGV|nr:homeobox-leucine zipper protein HAT9 [Elaeis guineensis]
MEMSQDDMCDTGLALGLGIRGRSSSSSDLHHRHEPWSTFPSITKPCKPSLTLGLSSGVYGATAVTKAESHKTYNEEFTPARLSSPHSTLSSFSTAYPPSIKREKDAGSDVGEVERVFSRASDEEEDASARKKLRLTKEQSALLEERFKEHSTLNPKQKQALAKQLHLRPRQVEVWFQNRRARTKLKQTEVDCEILKRCCETLTDENRRLKKELQELKALKFASPLYMRFPAAALTMCPSCERVSGASNGSSKGSGPEPFMVAQPKPHLLNPFTHSAAC